MASIKVTFLISIKLLLLILMSFNKKKFMIYGEEIRTKLQVSSENDEPTSYFATDALNELFDGQLTFDDYITYSMRALKQVAGYDTDLHRYDSKQDLINSFARNSSYTDDIGKLILPIVASEKELLLDQSELTLLENERNQVNCGKQINFLLQESSKLLNNSENFSTSKQLNLINLIDSFGSPNSQFMDGNFMWLGSYQQCLQAKITISSSSGESLESVKTRYCVANFRSPNWHLIGNDAEQLYRNDRNLGSQSVKLGICLPESCNSISISRHHNSIESLIKLTKLNQIPYVNYKMTHLFCLPDERSPLRQFSWSATIFISLASSWLTIVLYYSLKYEYNRMKWIQANGNDAKFNSTQGNCMKILALRLSVEKLFESGTREFPDKFVHKKQVAQLEVNKLTDEEQIERESGIDSCSEIDSRSSSDHEDESRTEDSHNKQTLDLTKVPNLTTTLKLNAGQLSLVGGYKLQLDRSTVVVVNNSSNNNNEQETSNKVRQQAADLAVVDGIKVISMIWLISAHTLLFFIRTISNGREFWSILKDARFLTVMAGIFPVDTFFTVTGVLTAFLKFNKNGGEAMSKVSYWIEAFVHRYFRFMPLYLIVFWYTRDVSEYIGSGPLWDYATAHTSLRSMCKQESVTVPLFFRANFKPLDEHCVKPAWYLANDYQFLLITPIFMALIMKSKLLGYSVIAISIATSLLMQFLTVFHSNLADFEVLINFKPLFGAYILKDLWKLYVLPYNRIPPYLIGILTGHLMFNLSRSCMKQSNEQADAKVCDTTKTKEDSASQKREPISRYSSSDMIGQEVGASKTSLISTLMSYICTKVWTPLILLISIIYLPLVSRLSSQEGQVAKIGTSAIIALMRFVWSLSVARLIYICATRGLNYKNDNLTSDSFVIRFLSSPKWKPWSKIGLSALLIQWEIISYLAQIQTNTPDMTITFLLSTMLISIVGTYLLAMLIYLTLEYPLSQLEQLYIHPTLFGKK